MILIITWYKETLFLFLYKNIYFHHYILGGELMNIDIRKSIKNNFKGSSIDEIRDSIENSITDNEEITLPGLGVFFEILWSNSDKDDKEFILRTIESNL